MNGMTSEELLVIRNNVLAEYGKCRDSEGGIYQVILRSSKEASVAGVEAEREGVVEMRLAGNSETDHIWFE